MKIPVYRIFISCVSSEFRGYRDQLRQCLTAPGREIKVQEEFADGGRTLLEKLDHYIASCQAVIHLVGDGCGCAPQPAEVRALLELCPDLPTSLPEMESRLRDTIHPPTYTQWEAVLAIYHRVDCYTYLAHETSAREPGWVANTIDSASQTSHLALLQALGKDRRMLPFEDARDVAIKFLNSVMLPSLPAENETAAARPGIEWPAPPERFDYDLADREPEVDHFIRIVTNQVPERIFLISGPSDRGKTSLVGVFAMLAARLGVHCGHAEFKTSLSLIDVLWGLSRDLNPVRFPRFEREFQRRATDGLRLAFLQDLDDATVPVLLILDTYEQATEEARKWVEDFLLPHPRRHDGLRLVLAGKAVPDGEGHAWARLAIKRELPPIVDAAPWHDYSRRVLKVPHSDDHMRLLVRAAQGSPRVLGNLLRNLQASPT